MEQFTNDGFTFDVTASGDPNKGTIVLLHGFPQTADSWRKVTPILNANGYRTIAPDQRGYSPGARPSGRLAYRTTHLVDDAAALVRQLGIGPVHVVGHDWGAAVAWGLAARNPELVRTLTSVSVPHPGAFVKSMLSSNQALKSWYMAAFQPPLLPELLVTRAPGLFDKVLANSGMDDAQIAEVHRRVIDSGALSGSLAWYRAMALSTPPDLARRVAVPTTHVFGAADTALSRRGAELTADFVIGDFALEVLEDAGHWIPEDNAAELSELILARTATVRH